MKVLKLFKKGGPDLIKEKRKLTARQKRNEASISFESSPKRGGLKKKNPSRGTSWDIWSRQVPQKTKRSPAGEGAGTIL